MAIITLTRGTYSGAKELGQYLSEKLGYKLLSRENIIDKLAEYGWVEEKLDKIRQKQLGILQRMNLEWIHYVACLRAVLSKEAQEEALVYHGNNGHAALKGFPHVLSIKAIADMKYRIKAVMERNEYAIDQKEAMEIIKRIDERRERWARFLYQTDGNDASEFDMIIDLSRKSIHDAYEMINATVSLPQFQSGPESKKTIENLTRAAQLRARIAMETDIIDDEIEVEVNNGLLNVKGVVHSLDDANKLREFLSHQPEVEQVVSHLEETPQQIDSG
ncbi:MAG: cytidylate kinase-like family protein [Dehalococcoidia bacterium]|nr:MAG: cytidylate kinase-like family protein [Dehalococcoidia bacterium]